MAIVTSYFNDFLENIRLTKDLRDDCQVSAKELRASAAQTSDLVDDGLPCSFVPTDEQHVCSLTGESKRGGAPKSGRSTGDHTHFPPHFFSPRASPIVPSLRAAFLFLG